MSRSSREMEPSEFAAAAAVRQRLAISAMGQEHVVAIAAMEGRNHAFPWSERIFRDCVKSGYACLLGEHAGQLVGYSVVQVAADEAHLLNLCIDAPYQRRGHAREFLDWIVDSVTMQRAHTLFLEVRPSNTRAVQLYEKTGFNEIGTRRDYYDAPGGREDALVMAKTLSTSA